MLSGEEYRWPGMMYGGAWHGARDGETFASVNPATGATIATAAKGGENDAIRAIDAASAALPSWKKRTAADRARVLHRIADRLETNRDRIARLITMEEGKPLAEALGEMTLTIDTFRWYAEEARRAYGSWIPDPVPGRRLLTMREAVGVVGAIIPWNVPVAMIARKAAPALAVGCTMVLKPAEDTPLSGLAVAEIMLEADLPEGVFNIVTGNPAAIGGALLKDERVRKISFTGSTPVGRLLLHGAADSIKRVSMELGGNAPVILFDDCDVKKAGSAVAALKFLNAGQACISANRIYVQRQIYDEVAEQLAQAAAGLKVGNGLEAGVRMGPLINDAAVRKVSRLVDDACEKGAKPLTGARRLSEGGYGSGFFYAPTVLANVREEMLLFKEEIFGPIAALYPFDTEEEVLTAANSVGEGLAAYIFTENMARAIRVVEQLEVGMVGVNEIKIGAAEAPFGGVKQSGLGREGGREGMGEYLETKLVALGI